MSKSSYHAVVADGERLPFPAASFDAVVSMDALEWTSDPVQFLTESARVCAPSGRVVCVNNDWDTVVYAATDEDLAKHVLRSFCDSGPAGWIARCTPALMRQAGLRESACSADVLLERSHTPASYGHGLANMIAEWLRIEGAIASDDIDRWLADLESQAARGDYLFSINRYVCIGRP